MWVLCNLLKALISVSVQKVRRWNMYTTILLELNMLFLENLKKICGFNLLYLILLNLFDILNIFIIIF